MSRFNFIFVLLIFLSCQNSESPITDSNKDTARKNKFKVQKRYIEAFTRVDTTKFPHRNLSDFDSILLDMSVYPPFPDTNMRYGDGYYYSDQTYSNNFRTYVIMDTEGLKADSWKPTLILITLDNSDSLISKQFISIGQGTESGSERIRTSFTTDSTLTLEIVYTEPSFDSSGYLGYWSVMRKESNLKINSLNGQIMIVKDTIIFKGRIEE